MLTNDSFSLLQMKEANIIGSGMAGMATAARLASQEYRVRVFEQNAYPGGKVTTTGDDHYRFDAGPSLFTLPELVDDLIRSVGKEPRHYFHYRRKEIACRYFWEDGTELTAWGDRERFAEEVEQVLGVKGQMVIDYLADAKRIYRYTTPVFLERSLHVLKSFLNAETFRAIGQMHRLHLFGTLHETNRKKLGHPKLVQLFDRFATYNGSSPYLSPGVMSSIPHLEHNVGTFYPEGGLHTVTQTLYQLCRDLGVEFRFEERVNRIRISGKKAEGVETEKGFYPGLTVSNMDIVPTYRRLMPEQAAPEQTLAQDRSSSALIFYWGLKRQFPELDLHNIFFSEDYRAEFAAIFEERTVSDDPTIYLNISSKEDPDHAPAGGENWFVMLNVPGNRGQDWDSLISHLRSLTLAKLSRRLGVAIEPLLAYEEVLDPRSIEAKTASYQGSLYGASSNNRMAAFLRHPNFTRKIKDLYFCGGSVHPGGGIPLCLLSAKITTGLIRDAKA